MISEFLKVTKFQMKSKLQPHILKEPQIMNEQ
jgi:hypothetical protein